jgi:uncharacterized protein (TIGR02145 family)
MIILSVADVKKLEFEEKLKLNQFDVGVLSEYAQFLYDNREYDNTIAILVKLLSIDSNNSFANYLLFNTYLNQKSYKNAIQIGDELLLKDPENKALLESMVKMANAQDDKAKELRLYNALVKLSPNDINLLSKQVNVLLQLEQISDATQIFCQLYSLRDRQRMTLIYKGIDQTTKGIYPDALQTFTSVLSSSETFPDDLHKQSFYLYLAFCYSQTDNSLQQIESTFSKINFSLLSKSETHVEMASKIFLHLLELTLIDLQTAKSKILKVRIDDLNGRFQTKVEDLASMHKTTTNSILALYWFKLAEALRCVGLFSEAKNAIINALKYEPMDKAFSEKLNEIAKQLETYERKRKIKNAILICGAILIVIIAVISIKNHFKNKEIETWKMAITANTVDAYKQYSNRYPEGVYKITADSLVDILSWATATSTNTVESYKYYLDSLPRGKYRFQADSIMTAYVNDKARLAEMKANRCADIDGNVYKTIKIGNQLWMAENLRVTHYRNGEVIPNVTDNNEWAHLTTGAYCNYDNNPTNGRKYGKLYNWYAVDDYRGLAPAGWHVATDEEWTTLTNYLKGEDVAGGKLKSKTGWKQPNEGATNESGYCALPSGHRYGDGASVGLGEQGFWWSSTEYSATNAKGRFMGNYGKNVISNVNDYYSDGKVDGFSIRCVKN